MDELANIIGCKPRLYKYFFTDPQLAIRLLFQGLVPYQFRLDGPHSWSGAREAIMGMEKRMVENTMTRKMEKDGKSDGTGFWRAIGGFM
jgi:dimethylaniline monooxygenase (N-oxide forming)